MAVSLLFAKTNIWPLVHIRDERNLDLFISLPIFSIHSAPDSLHNSFLKITFHFVQFTTCIFPFVLIYYSQDKGRS
nr:MAG TPA: hypothetical protein [Caudoviricetes sp.]